MFEAIATLGFVGAALGLIVQFVWALLFPTGKERPTDYLLYALIGVIGIFIGPLSFLSAMTVSLGYNKIMTEIMISNNISFVVWYVRLAGILLISCKVAERLDRRMITPAILIITMSLFGIVVSAGTKNAILSAPPGFVVGGCLGMIAEWRRGGRVRLGFVLLYGAIGAVLFVTAGQAVLFSAGSALG